MNAMYSTKSLVSSCSCSRNVLDSDIDKDSMGHFHSSRLGTNDMREDCPLLPDYYVR
jgi:hypothetical protein